MTLSERLARRIAQEGPISFRDFMEAALYDPEEPEHNLGTLHRLSQLTGGEVFVPAQVSEIGALCLRIAKDIRASYTLAYTPPNPDQYKTPRKIRVVASAPVTGKLKVRARTSYTLEKATTN